jgi:hypothetical protein
MAGAVVQAAELQFCKCKALSSNPSPTKKKKKKEEPKKKIFKNLELLKPTGCI